MILLIVEDNEQMRRTIKSCVEDLATEIYECADGAEALAAFESSRADWVFMDIEMPQMDGISATRQIKNLFPAARVIIVSNYDDPDLRAAAHQAGACDYVVKENLLNLRRILSAKAAANIHCR